MAASAGSSDSAADAEEVLELDAERFDALVRGDWDAFAALCDPLLRYTHSTARTDTLDSYVARGRSGHYDYQRIEHPVNDVVVYGEIALIFGQMRSDMVAGGTPRHLDNVTLSIWRKSEGRWRLLAYQPTARPDLAPITREGQSLHE